MLKHQECGSQRTAQPGERWFCVVAQPGRDLIATWHLQRESAIVTTWLPLCVDRRGPPRITSLFPGYLFVRFDPRRIPWGWIAHQVGVRCLYGSAGNPQPLPHGVVEALIEAADPAGIIDATPAPAALPIGARVRITAGPFAGEIATIQRLLPGDRVRLLHALIAAEITIPRDNVEAL